MFQLLQVLPIFYCTELSEPGFGLGVLKRPGDPPGQLTREVMNILAHKLQRRDHI